MATAGVAPRLVGIGPAPATQKVLAVSGLKIEQMDVIELNEAFAAQGLAVPRLLGLQDDDACVNAWGWRHRAGPSVGGLGRAPGHHGHQPLARHRGLYALCTMCIGVGQGIVVILERV